jgi:hypothetical protein
MHARDLVETAACAAFSGGALVTGQSRPSPASVEQYWTASKCRLERWSRAFKSAEAARSGERRFGPSVERPRELPALLEEILSGEVLTRVWTAALAACERVRGTSEIEPMARSVYVAHLEARHRTLNLLVEGRGLHAADAVALNLLRRRAERWTDVLLGYLMVEHDVRELAFEPDRVADFADDLRHERRTPSAQFGWPLMMASLRAAFRTTLSPRSPNPDLNERIASSVLASFGADAFDSLGMARSLWMVRLSNFTDDTQGLLDELLAVDRHPGGGRKSFRRDRF